MENASKPTQRKTRIHLYGIEMDEMRCDFKDSTVQGFLDQTKKQNYHENGIAAYKNSSFKLKDVCNNNNNN